MKLTKIVIIAACAIAAFSCAPKAQEVSEPSALDVIMSRKSVRTYTDQALTDAQIETLLRAAMAAPTGMNVQPWRFVVVRDQAVKDALAGPRGGMVAQAPCVIVVCGETTMSRSVLSNRCHKKVVAEKSSSTKLFRGIYVGDMWSIRFKNSDGIE